MRVNLHRIHKMAAEPALPTGHFNPARSGEVFVPQQDEPWGGFTGEQQKLWKLSDVKSPEEALQWMEAGVEDPQHANDYKNAGLDPYTILPWITEFSHVAEGGRLKEAIIEWHQAGWSDPEEAAEWYAQGHFKDNPEDALLWHQAGWKDLDAAAEWHRKPTWKDDPAVALKWYQMGYTPTEARGQ